MKTPKTPVEKLPNPGLKALARSGEKGKKAVAAMGFEKGGIVKGTKCPFRDGGVVRGTGIAVQGGKFTGLK